MGEFRRDLLPGWAEYADREGLTLEGRGTWRTTRCDFHGGSDSLRVNVDSGGWVCMACGIKGGDVIAYHQQLHGLDFVAAAKALGAFVEDSKPYRRRDEPRRFSDRDALSVVGEELTLCALVVSEARRGVTPSAGDWERFLVAAGRVMAIAERAKR